MTVTRLKPVANFRATPVRTSTPEPIEIEGGVALLAEAPADPGSPSWPMTVTVNGSPRARVTTTPAAGQFRVMTQTVIGANGQAVNEYLPLLQFHTSDEGLGGTADYWQSGSVLTSQFFTTLVSFLTPLTGYATIDNLPPATSAQTVRGKPGDIAFLTSGEMAYSTGTEWIIFSGSTPSLMGGLSLGQTIAIALDAGYVGPSLDGAHSFDAAQGFGADASYVLGVAADETLGAILGLTVDAVVAHVGAHSYGQAFGVDLDASWAGPSVTGDLTLGQSIAMSLDATYAAGAPSEGITYVGAGTPIATAYSYGSENVSLPAVEAGDVLVMAAFGLVSIPAGWSVKASDAPNYVIWTRATQASGPATVTIESNSGGGEGGYFGARSWAFRGAVGSGDPFNAADASFIAATASTATVSGSALDIAANSMIGFIVASDNGKTANTAGGSVDTLVAGGTADPAFHLAYDSTPPEIAGTQPAPSITFNARPTTSLNKFTFALKAA